MIVKGLCRYCSKPGIMHTCSMCGAGVCSEHYDNKHGLCVKCAEKLKR